MFFMSFYTMVSSSAISCLLEPTNAMAYEERGIVFRSTQKLKSNDGREIYLYSNRRCELYDGDRLEVVCTYKIVGNEIRLLDENGNTVYKGSIQISSDRQSILHLSIAGTTYYKKR